MQEVLERPMIRGRRLGPDGVGTEAGNTGQRAVFTPAALVNSAGSRARVLRSLQVRAGNASVNRLLGAGAGALQRQASGGALGMDGVVRRPQRGQRVRRLQSQLAAVDAAAGLAVDGIFGPLTEAAVIAFQEANGLEGDGIVGPLTGPLLAERAGITTGAEGGPAGAGEPAGVDDAPIPGDLGGTATLVDASGGSAGSAGSGGSGADAPSAAGPAGDVADGVDSPVDHPLEGRSCTPYPSDFIAELMRVRMTAQLLPAVLGITGSSTNVSIWTTYLAGGGAFSLSDDANPSDPLVASVRTDEDQVPNAVHAILDSIERRLDELAQQHLRGRDSVTLPLATLVPPGLLAPRLEWILTAKPAANVIGEIGGSDVFGADTRRIDGTVTLIKQHRRGDRLTVDVRGSANLAIHVHDTADFCPGNIGPGFLQNFTIPLSRLEAHGLAGDVGIDVLVHERHRSTGLVNVRDPDVEG